MSRISSSNFPISSLLLSLLLISLICCISKCHGMAINLLDAGQLSMNEPNFCNDSSLLEEFQLQRSPLGQFIGYPCSAEFYHCRWQSDGFRTYKKSCKMGLVYDTMGTQNCNFDFNVKGCGMRSDGADNCQKTEFSCPLSESCVSLSLRCDGQYDCLLEEDEQNCPMCSAGEFPCIVSEQCISSGGRCNGIKECSDGTDEMNCEGCGEGMFHCLKSSECIPISQRCDGVPQCTHAEDEALCKVTHERFYVCENRLDQVPILEVCNGIENCPDGSDEKYCSQTPRLPPTPPPLAPPPPPALGQTPNPYAKFPMQNLNEIEEDYDRDQQQRYVQEQQQPEAEEEEGEEEESDDDAPPVSPLMPIARFFPAFTTTQKPSTKLYTAAIRVETMKPPKKVFPATINPRPEIKSRPITSSISEVAVTAAAPIRTISAASTRKPLPPIPYVRPSMPNREKVVASVVITTTPQVPTFPTKATTIAESMDQLEEQLIAKLGARFNGQNKFSARDILNKLESLLSSSSDPAPASASHAIPSLPKQPFVIASPYPSSQATNTNIAYPPPLPSASSSYSSSSLISYDPSASSSASFPDNITKTSVLETRQIGGFGSHKLRSRVRVTGKPSLKKWRPSLSINPSLRTTPTPQSEAEIAVQFRQSDASKSTTTTPKSPAVRPLPKLLEVPKPAHSTMHKRVVAASESVPILPRALPEQPLHQQLLNPKPTAAKDALEESETYFTYDEHP